MPMTPATTMMPKAALYNAIEMPCASWIGFDPAGVDGRGLGEAAAIIGLERREQPKAFALQGRDRVPALTGQIVGCYLICRLHQNGHHLIGRIDSGDREAHGRQTMTTIHSSSAKPFVIWSGSAGVRSGR